jgi:hypothetical protein
MYESREREEGGIGKENRQSHNTWLLEILNMEKQVSDSQFLSSFLSLCFIGLVPG